MSSTGGISKSKKDNQCTSRLNKKTNGLNFVKHPHLLPVHWASVSASFQEILEKFIVSSSWTLPALRKIAVRHGLELVLNGALTYLGSFHEKKRHYQLTFQSIFEAAKFQWLSPWKKVPTIGLTTCIKRQIGGFYLVCLIAFEQLRPDILFDELQTITLDNEDVASIRCFFEDVAKVPDKDMQQRINKMWAVLGDKQLLTFTICQDEFESDAAAIYFLELKNHPAFYHHARMKDIRDVYLYTTYQGVGNTLFREIMDSISKWSVAAKTSNESSGENSSKKVNKFPLTPKTHWTVKDVEDLYEERDLGVIAVRFIELLKWLTPRNVITESCLTGSKDVVGFLQKEVSDIRKQNLWNQKSRKDDETRWKKRADQERTQEMTNFKMYMEIDTKNMKNSSVKEIRAGIKKELAGLYLYGKTCTQEKVIVAENIASPVNTSVAAPAESSTGNNRKPRKTRNSNPKYFP